MFLNTSLKLVGSCKRKNIFILVLILAPANLFIVFDKTKIAASVANFSVISPDEDQIAANLVKKRPTCSWWPSMQSLCKTYVGGVSCPYICSKRLDHGVLLVGYGFAAYAPIRMKEKPYWIIKNSWGENWGKNGYYKICRGRNICGVDYMVSLVAGVLTTT